MGSITTVLQNIQKPAPVFSRHETFYPRFGWLKKGFDKSSRYPDLFTKDDAPVILGVGKNMVAAIRYWCTAFKILKMNPETRESTPTDFGKNLFSDNGWDPFLEELASLWLLHWRLLTPPCQASTWHYVFSVIKRFEFTQQYLNENLSDWVLQEYPNVVVSPSSLEKDLTCLRLMYTKKTAKKISEDTLDCPFASLGILKEVENSENMSFNIGEKPGLVAEIVSAACLEFAGHHAPNANTIGINRLLYEEGSPGMCFKLNESTLCAFIEETSRKYKFILLKEAAGLMQFSFVDEPMKLANKLLNSYYSKRDNN